MRYTKAERKQHVKQQSVCDQTIVAYCEEHEINYHTFNNWRRKYKPIEQSKQEAITSGSFVEVGAPGPGVGFGGTNIYLPNGVRLQLDREVDAALLKLLSHV